MANKFRLRLFAIKSENELWEYFEENSSFNEKLGVYSCAGIYDSDTHNLWTKLIEAWNEDIAYEAQLLLRQ